MLGMVDDMLGVTEAGHKAQEMNTIIGYKSAEKRLQFGSSKCKKILVGKSIQNFHRNSIFVDNWTVEYKCNKPIVSNDKANICCSQNKYCNDVIMTESYMGKVEMEEVKCHKYLGHYISNEKNNRANIEAIKKKAIGIKKTIISSLTSLNLGRYYFECAIIRMKVLLRKSILYSAETYYNLKEDEIRDIEKIEEDFIRSVVGTERGCPISQLYLQFGLYPARFDLMKTQVLFFHYILNQDENSLIYKFLKVQMEDSVQGDWITNLRLNIIKLGLHLSDDQIKWMNKKKLNCLLNDKIQEKSFQYLINLRRRKGSETRQS